MNTTEFKEIAVYHNLSYKVFTLLHLFVALFASLISLWTALYIWNLPGIGAKAVATLFAVFAFVCVFAVVKPEFPDLFWLKPQFVMGPEGLRVSDLVVPWHLIQEGFIFNIRGGGRGTGSKLGSELLCLRWSSDADKTIKDKVQKKTLGRLNALVTKVRRSSENRSILATYALAVPLHGLSLSPDELFQVLNSYKVDVKGELRVGKHPGWVLRSLVDIGVGLVMLVFLAVICYCVVWQLRTGSFGNG